MSVERRCIDWETTGKALKNLRCNDLNMRRYVCRTLNPNGCDNFVCEKCQEYDIDNHISQDELAEVMSVTKNMIVNWERGVSRPTIEDLMLYADICKMDLFDILVFY